MTEPDTTPLRVIRRHILAGRDMALLDHPERVMMPLPKSLEPFSLTPLMRYLQNKYGVRVERVLARGSLFDAQRFWKFEVDRSTLCRWRDMIKKNMGETYPYD